jgi:hypothetical protein
VVSYATRADLFQHGLTRGLLEEERRLITSVDVANDRFSIGQHGLAADQVVELVEDEGGTLPSPLATATTYYAKPVAGSESLLQLAATAGGAAISLTDDGTGTFGLFVPINATMDAALEYVSREIDRSLIGHQVELTAPYPVEVVGICAKLAAEELLDRLGRASERITAAAERARRKLPALARGMSLRDAAATASANEPEVWGDGDRGWTLADGAII